MKRPLLAVVMVGVAAGFVWAMACGKAKPSSEGFGDPPVGEPTATDGGASGGTDGGGLVGSPDGGASSGDGGNPTDGGAGNDGGGSGSDGGLDGGASCSVLTCAGCCAADGGCVAGGQDAECGSGGVACAACSGNRTCNSALKVCVDQSCQGCVDTQLVCQAGTTESACGGNGLPCEVCIPGATCTAFLSTFICLGGTTCPGCWWTYLGQSACSSGTLAVSCGTDGGPCKQCGAGKSCINGACT